MSKSIEKHRKTFSVAAPWEAWGPLRVLPSVPPFVFLLLSRPLVCAQKKSLRGMQHLQSFGCTDVDKRKKASRLQPFDLRFKLALASIVALVFLYLLNCLNTSQPYVCLRASKLPTIPL